MKVNFPSPAWWHATPEKIPPLQALRIALEAIEKEEPIPEPAAGIMAHALRAYLDGQTTDLTGALGLRPRRGGSHETPLAQEKQRENYALIRKIFDLQTGTKNERVKKVSELLKLTPANGVVTEGRLMAYVLRLHCENGGIVPSSIRHIRRIISSPD